MSKPILNRPQAPAAGDADGILADLEKDKDEDNVVDLSCRPPTISLNLQSLPPAYAPPMQTESPFCHYQNTLIIYLKTYINFS